MNLASALLDYATLMDHDSQVTIHFLISPRNDFEFFAHICPTFSGIYYNALVFSLAMILLIIVNKECLMVVIRS